jgi:hypothetical protein
VARSTKRVSETIINTEIKSWKTGDNKADGNEVYFGGGFLTKSIPLSILPLRPCTAASSSFFSPSVIEPRISIACSAPEVCLVFSRYTKLENSGITYTELHGDGEKVDSRVLSNFLSAWNTGQVDERGLDNSAVSLESLDDVFGESRLP